MNDPAFHQFAVAFARRITTEAKAQSSEVRIRYAFQVCLARDPDPDELERFKGFIEKSPDQQAAWVSIASVLLNLDETLTRE